MNLALWTGVADFAAKADFFTRNSALAGVLFLAFAFWLRPSVGRVFGRRDLAFVSCVLVIPFIVVAGAFRLSAVGLGVTAIMLITAGFAERRWMSSPAAGAARASSPRSPVEVWSERAAVATIL